MLDDMLGGRRVGRQAGREPKSKNKTKKNWKLKTKKEKEKYLYILEENWCKHDTESFFRCIFLHFVSFPHHFLVFHVSCFMGLCYFSLVLQKQLAIFLIYHVMSFFSSWVWVSDRRISCRPFFGPILSFFLSSLVSSLCLAI